MPLSTTPKNKIDARLIIVILFVSTIGQIVSDLYIPSMPAMARALQASHTSIQASMFVFLLGFSISHLFYGPLSDRIGRRPPILFGLALNVFGSLCCVLAPHVSLLIAGRFIQGVGIGACSAVGRSITRDVVSGQYLARFSSNIGLISVCAITSAPMLGGYLQHFFSWRSSFLFLLLYGLLVLFISWRYLRETNLNLNHTATQPKIILSNYWMLLRSKVFLGYSICSGCTYAGLAAYLTVSPFLLQNVVGLTPVQYGWLSLIFGGAIFFSTFINGRFVMKYGYEKMILFGTLFMFGSGVVMLLLALLGFLNTFVVMLPVSLCCMAAGLTFANAFAGAFHPFPQIAGTASALYGCLQILIGSLVSTMMSLVHETSQIPLSILYISIGAIAWSSYQFLASNDVNKNSTHVK